MNSMMPNVVETIDDSALSETVLTPRYIEYLRTIRKLESCVSDPLSKLIGRAGLSTSGADFGPLQDTIMKGRGFC